MGKRGFAPGRTGKPTGQSKRKKWMDTSKAKGIPKNTRGVIVSAVIGKERQATQEAIAVLSESLEALGGPKRDGDGAVDDQDNGKATDISKLLKSEIDDLKDRSKHDFIVRDMGLPSTIYLVCNFSSPSPSEIVYHALDTVRKSQQNKSRFCHRWFPIEYTSSADLDQIKEMGAKVAKEAFGVDRKEKTFGVDLEFRAKPKDLERMDVINAFAGHVRQPPWKVDLDAPDLTVLVNVVKGTCGCAVVREYRALKRYNLGALVEHDEVEDKEDKAETEAE